jgi:methionyl-tRNA synthetase
MDRTLQKQVKQKMTTKDELKARLLKEAEKAIDEVLAKKTAADKIRLDEIEQLSLKSGEQFRASIQQALVADGSEAQSAGGHNCEQCGRRMQRRGLRARQVETEAGRVTVDRAYYVCPQCGASFFPPG